MACKFPLLRIPPKYAEDLPPHLCKQVKNNSGLIISQDFLPIVLQYLPLSDLQEIPCGHCTQCFLKRSRDWACRILLEAKQYDHNYFITLTYDDAHLPKLKDVDYVIDLNGEVFDTELDIKDFQGFMKRFRSKVSDDFDLSGMRIAYCGEYGELFTKRPHFHLLLMNSPDLTSFLRFKCRRKKGKINATFYKCPYIEKLWGKGIVEVSDLTFATAAYVAGYVYKKQYKGDSKPPDNPNGFRLRKAPFFKVSNRPGIAREYFDKHFRDIYNDDLVLISENFKLLKLKPPRYFDKLFDAVDPLSFDAIKQDRIRDVRLNTDIAHFDYQKKLGEISERRLKLFKGRNSEL